MAATDSDGNVCGLLVETCCSDGFLDDFAATFLSTVFVAQAACATWSCRECVWAAAAVQCSAPYDGAVQRIWGLGSADPAGDNGGEENRTKDQDSNAAKAELSFL
jgi:hypothetical protein